jgi:PD-(D/E)XK nuclease superfamily
MHRSPSAFLAAIKAFAKSKTERAKGWPEVINNYRAAFVRSRAERAAYTPHLNVLAVFNLKLRELCHSAALAWFLDENGSHEQGPLFLRSLAALVKLGVSQPQGYRVQREHPDRVDVAIIKKNQFAIFIENKVEHIERDKQMEDLVRSLISTSDNNAIPIPNRIAIFLTDDGRNPTSLPCEMPSGILAANIYPLRRTTLFEQFRRSLEGQAAKSPLLAALVESYAMAISTHPGRQ